jgi:hypothetical protein
MRWTLFVRYYHWYGWSDLTTYSVATQSDCYRILAGLDPGDGVIIFKIAPDID